jgi:acyl dehydratase
LETLGLFFEDFPVGKSGGSVGKTITLTDIKLFNEMSGWPDYFISGEQSAPEMFLTMISAGFMTRQGIYEGTLLGIVNNFWRYKTPVFAGDTLKMTYTVSEASLSKKRDKGVITLKIRTFNQRNETVAEGEMKAMMRARES